MSGGVSRTVRIAVSVAAAVGALGFGATVGKYAGEAWVGSIAHAQAVTVTEEALKPVGAKVDEVAAEAAIAFAMAVDNRAKQDTYEAVQDQRWEMVLYLLDPHGTKRARRAAGAK